MTVQYSSRMLTDSHVRDVTGRVWQLGECLGQGTFAKVYATCDDDAVVKVFRTKQSYTRELFAYQSLFTEPAVSAYKLKRGLGHLGFPALLGHGHDKVYFTVLQKLYPVEQLTEVTYRDNNLVMMIVQLLDVLEFLHVHHWTHNDIKCDNIMLDAHRNFYLVDYGLVTCFLDAKEAPVDGPVVIGTRQYMSLDAHRGFINSPRGDLVNLMFVLKLLLTEPWAVDKHEFSTSTALLIEKEAFAAAPECGAFTSFCRAVLAIEYAETPDYRRLKTLLPVQPKIERLRVIYTQHCGFVPASWVFAGIFQTHILPYLSRLSRQLHALRQLKASKIALRDLLFMCDTPPSFLVGSTPPTFSAGLAMLCEPIEAYTSDAATYMSACVVGWVVHVAKALRRRREKRSAPVGVAVHQLTAALSTARF